MNNGLDGLNSKELILYNTFFSKDKENSKNIKDHISKGGSLDELVGVASKILKDKNLDYSTRRSIYKTLGQAIEGKKVYYKSSAKGKLANALRKLPFLPKASKESPLERARNKLDSIDLRNDKEREMDRSSLVAMYDHYINETEFALNNLKQVLESLEKDQNFIKANPTVYYILPEESVHKKHYDWLPEGIAQVKREISSLEEEQKDMVKKKKYLSDKNRIPPKFTSSRNESIFNFLIKTVPRNKEIFTIFKRES